MIPRLLLVAMLLSCASAERSDGRYIMGTVLEISLADSGRPEVMASLFERATALEGILSHFDPESGVSRLNRAAGTGPLRVEPELGRLLQDAILYSELSDGTFDISVGPLMELWANAGRRGRRPDAAELARTLERVGSGRIRTLEGGTHAELTRAGMSIDLGGIAKGFALDELVVMLRARGVRNALLNFGRSSLHGLGRPRGAEGWRVLIPDAAEGFVGVATLRNQALSVSSSHGQVFSIGGERFGHVIDPRTGEPLATRRVAVVVADTGSLAEALSKALLVHPVERGVALLEALPGVEGLVIDAAGGRRSSTGWSHAVSFETFANSTGATGAAAELSVPPRSPAFASR